jgi:hypothetical protein
LATEFEKSVQRNEELQKRIKSLQEKERGFDYKFKELLQQITDLNDQLGWYKDFKV